MLKKLSLLIILSLVFLTNTSQSLESSWQGINEAKLRLISPFYNTNSSENITIGLEYKLDENWKTYWKSPGAGGFPQEIDYSKSLNVKNLKILWPTPEQFSILGLNSLGYKNSVIFPLKFEVINKLQPITLDINIHFLTCKEICIPVDANLKLFIPFGKKLELTEHSNLIEKFISLSPINNDQTIDVNKAIFHIENNNSVLELEIQNDKSFINPNIYIDNEIGLPVIKPVLKLNELENILNIKFYYEDTYIDTNINNVIIHVADFPFVAEKNVNFKISKAENIFNYNFLNIIFIAILGGLILNVMPCVFPVLSIKLLSVLSHVGQKKSFIRKGFISTGLGIIISYFLISLFLIFLKYSGQQIGWGIQFQQSSFLMFISLILLFFALNLLDLFQIRLPSSVSNLLFKSSSNKSFLPDFFTGFFATLLATPCSAPFVGTAVAFAFSQRSEVLIAVLCFMGFGMASPYFLISMFPGFVDYLPKPGKWIIWVRRLMAILILLTLVWIGSILTKHFNLEFIYISIILAIIITLILILKIKINFSSLYNFLFISIIISIYLLLPSFVNFSKYQSLENKNWINFNEININQLVSKNKIVFVDITADWCVTCQYNKQNVINSNEIQEIFKKNEVIMVRGDWTLPNKKIETFLNSFNRFGIPFNVFFSYNLPDGVIMSEILTKNAIKEALIKIKEEK